MLSLVVATGLGGEIGRNNQLLWKLPRDLKHFKEITTGHPVIMGRKTYESIGKPLSDRTNIIISSKDDWYEEGVLIVGTVKEAIKFAKKINDNIYIIGGGSIYKQTIDIADRIEMTVVKSHFQADTFFPKIDEAIWIKIKEIFLEKDEKNSYDLCFQTWERKKDHEI